MYWLGWQSGLLFSYIVKVFCFEDIIIVSYIQLKLNSVEGHVWKCQNNSFGDSGEVLCPLNYNFYLGFPSKFSLHK